MTRERFFVATDLEGVVGVDSFTQTRSGDAIPERKERAMKRLAVETNACVDGIRSVYPDAKIDVLDGHGSGGLHAEDVRDARYLRSPEFDPFRRHEYDALLMVGRHAMAGTAFAPLRHTQSSTGIEYYKLDGTFVGEIAGTALRAGAEGVPLVYVSGDDKAVAEARLFVPDVRTTITKYGYGVEEAEHRDPDEVEAEIRTDAAAAVAAADDVAPFDDFDPPYRMEVRFVDPDPELRDRWLRDDVEIERVDDRTVRLRSDEIGNVYP